MASTVFEPSKQSFEKGCWTRNSPQQEDDYGFFVDDCPDDRTPCSPLLFSEIKEEIIDHIIEDDVSSVIADSPILRPMMVRQIVEEGLPYSLRGMRWNRLFRLSRDGASFGQFMRKVRGQSNTVIVARTSHGNIIGGFATEPWSGRRKAGAPCERFAGHRAFLFSSNQRYEQKGCTHIQKSSFIPGFEPFGRSPTSTMLDIPASGLLSTNGSAGHVAIRKPSHLTNFKHVCQIGNKYIAMGIGDMTSFGLCISNSFSRGSTSLLLEDDYDFEIAEFEVFGFLNS